MQPLILFAAGFLTGGFLVGTAVAYYYWLENERLRKMHDYTVDTLHEKFYLLRRTIGQELYAATSVIAHRHNLKFEKSSLLVSIQDELQKRKLNGAAGLTPSSSPAKGPTQDAQTIPPQ